MPVSSFGTGQLRSHVNEKCHFRTRKTGLKMHFPGLAHLLALGVA